MAIKKFIKQRILLLFPDFNIEEKELYREVKEKVIENIRIRLFIMAVFLTATPLLKMFFHLNVPLFYAEGILVIMVIYTILSYPVVREEFFKTAANLSLFYLIYLCVDVMFVSLLFIFWGFLSWIYIIPTYYIIYGYLVFPKYWQSFVMFLAASLSVVFVHSIVFFGFMSASPSLIYLDLSYLRDINFVATAVINVIFIYYFVAQWCCMFASRLKDEKERLRVAKQDLETERRSLEGKVQARTVELVKERAMLEEKVQVRTKELKERVYESEQLAEKHRQKINELENFQKLTVGRELKMVELKKELEKSKEKLEKNKSNENT